MRRAFALAATRWVLACTLSVHSLHALANSSDDELEQMLQQGLRKPLREDANPTSPKEVAPPAEKNVAPPAPVKEAPPAKAKVGKEVPVASEVVKPAPPAATAPVSQAAPVAPSKPSALGEAVAPAAPVSPTVSAASTVPAAPNSSAAGTATNTASGSQSAATPANAPAGAPNGAGGGAARKPNVSAAVNADQAALTGGAAKAWSVIASLYTNLGVGTFVANQHARNPYVGQTLMVEPAYVVRFAPSFAVRLSARQFLDWEFTKADNNSGRQFNYTDTLLGGSALLYKIPTAEVMLWGAFRMPVPISRQSQAATLITAVQPSVGASRSFDFAVTDAWHMSLNVRYDFGMRKNFHRSTVPGFANSNDPSKNTSGAVGLAPTVLARSDDPVIDGTLFRGGANTDFSMFNSAQVAFTPHELVTLSLWLQITNGFRYPISGPDEFVAGNARAGAGRVDEMRTNIDVTFNVLPYFFVSTGVFTVQPPFTPDNRSLNNPVINTDSAASNLSQFYVALTGMI